MKQTILILMFLLVLTGCLEEGSDGCPDYIRLTFLHNDSSEDFDREIGNDILLFLYYNDHLHSATTIPYEKIKGGKEYLIRKEVTGNMDIVAWAVPAGEDALGQIPVPEEEQTRSGQIVTMKFLSGSGYYEALGNLYLGTAQQKNSDITNESNFNISMTNCICRFTATMNQHKPLASLTDSDWFFAIEGIKSEMDLNFQPKGNDAIVQVQLIEDNQANLLKTPMQGLLPSAEDQYISVKAYYGDTHIFTVHTQHQAKPGDVIHLEIVQGNVIIYINDWILYDSVVEWM